jgi:hypothetical protein
MSDPTIIPAPTPLPRHLKPREVQPVPTFTQPLEPFAQKLAESLQRSGQDGVRSAYRECNFYDMDAICEAIGADKVKLWAWIIKS